MREDDNEIKQCIKGIEKYPNLAIAIYVKLEFLRCTQQMKTLKQKYPDAPPDFLPFNEVHRRGLELQELLPKYRAATARALGRPLLPEPQPNVTMSTADEIGERLNLVFRKTLES